MFVSISHSFTADEGFNENDVVWSCLRHGASEFILPRDARSASAVAVLLS